MAEGGGNAPAAAAGAAAADPNKVKLSLPPFKGDGDTDAQMAAQFKHFVRRFEGYCGTLRLATEAEKLSALGQCFPQDSRASIWFENAMKDPGKQMNTWDNVKALMAERFDLDRTVTEMADYRDGLRLETTGKVRDYGDLVERYQREIIQKKMLLNVPGMTNEGKARALEVFSVFDMKETFVLGLYPALRAEVEKQPEPATFQELVNLAAKAERALRTKEKEKKEGNPRGQGPLDSGQTGIDEFGRPASGGQKKGKQKGGKGGQSGQSGDNRTFKPTSRPTWVRFNMLPQGTCFCCGYQGHFQSQCTVPPERQNWQKLVQKGVIRAPTGVGSMDPDFAMPPTPWADQPMQVGNAPAMVGSAAVNTNAIASALWQLQQQQQQPQPPTQTQPPSVQEVGARSPFNFEGSFGDFR